MFSRRLGLLVSLGFALAALVAAPRARAGPFDLDDDKEEDKSEKKEGDSPAPPPMATIKPHAYTLQECLLLAERNHPLLWASRARLAAVHGELDEARWTPFSYWGLNASAGFLPPLGGTPFYNATPYTLL